MFNNIFEKGRSLAGCYDCGTIGRAVFMTYIKMKNDCYEISESSKIRNYNDVCKGFNLDKLCFFIKDNLEKRSRSSILIFGNNFLSIVVIFNDPKKIVSCKPLKFKILSVKICPLS